MKEKKSAVVLVFNSKNQLALQLRAADDSSYPLHYDFSAAGGIDEGEDQKHAAVRELREELGIDGLPDLIGEYQFEDEKIVDTLYVFRLIYDGHFSPDPKEVDDVKFFSLLEIEQMLMSGDKFHPEFPFLWNMGIIK